MVKVYLLRRNLLTLLSKLDRRAAGEVTECTILKHDNLHPVYPQTEREIAVIAVEDEEYYTDRNPGAVHPKDENRKPPETRDEKITRLEEEKKFLEMRKNYPALEAAYEHLENTKRLITGSC